MKGGDRVIAIHQSGRSLNVGLISYAHDILVPFKYYRITKVSRTRFAVQNYEGKIALFSDSGQRLTDFDIDSIGKFQGNYAKFYSDRLVGLLDQNGGIKMEAQYKSITIGDEIEVNQFPSWERFTESSRKSIDLKADLVTPIDSHTFLLERNGGYKIIGPGGSESSFYDFIKVISPNTWHVSLNQKHGIIDSAGYEVVPIVFDSLRIDKEFAYAYNDGEGSLTGWNVFDIYGTKRSRFVYEAIGNYSDGLFPVKRNGRWGFMNRNGKEVIYCVYDDVSVFSRDLIIVSFHGESGVIDRKGNWVITPRKGTMELINKDYFLLKTPRETRFYSTPNNLIYFTQNPIRNVDGYLLEQVDSGKYWQIDYDGVRIQESAIEDMYPIYKDSVYVINDRGRVGLRVRGSKDVYFSPNYQELFPPSDGLMRVKVDNRYGFVDFDGKLRIAHRYDKAGDFKEGLAPIQLRGKWGFINKDEEIAIQPLYDSVTDFENGLAKVEKEGLYGLITVNGTLIESIRFEWIEKLETGHFLISEQGLSGLLDERGEIIILPKYDKIIDLDSDRLIVSKEGKYGIIGISGVGVLPTSYSRIIYNKYSNSFLVAKAQEPIRTKK
jgi:hypothetical protein